MAKQQLSQLNNNLSVVLVNYNAGEHLINCLRSLTNHKDNLKLEIWVVDNDSMDHSLERAKKEFPDINCIANSDNKGFGAANNQALKKINNELILMINPDVVVGEKTLPVMVKYMLDHPEAGAATCKSLINDTKLDWSCHRGFPTPWASLLYFLGNDKFYHLTDRDMKKTHEVDAISGSFFLTRKSVLDKVGLFDEDYWMYAEDIDHCFRIKKAGYKVMFVPDVSVNHIKGISSGIKAHSQEYTTATVASRIKAFNAFYETMKIFYKKHMACRYPFFINWLIYGAVDLKWFLAKRKLHV